MAKTSKSSTKSGKKTKKTPNSKKSKKSEKKPINHKKILILASIFLILIISIFFGVIKINFLVGEEIIIKVNPQFESIQTKTNSQIASLFEIEFQNYWLCTAKCDYYVKDVSTNEFLTNGTFEFGTYYKQEVNEKIFTQNYGYGQKIIQYSVSCKNEMNGLCPTNNNSFNRKSTKTINYEPSDEQKNVEEIFKQKFIDSNSKLVLTDKTYEEIIQITANIEKDLSSEYLSTLKNIKLNIDDKEIKLKELLNLWNTQDYETIQNISNDDLFLEEFSQISDELLEKKNDLLLRINKTNELILKKNELDEETQKINEILSTGFVYSADLTELEKSIEEIDVALSSDFLLDEQILENYYEQIDLIFEEYENTIAEFESSYVEDNPYLVDLFLEKDLLCARESSECNLFYINFYRDSSIPTINKTASICGETKTILEKESIVTETPEVEQEKLKVAWSILKQYELKLNNESLMSAEVKKLLIIIENRLQEDYNESINDLNINYYPNLYDNHLSENISSGIYESVAELIKKNNFCALNKRIEITYTDYDFVVFPELSYPIKDLLNISNQENICCIYGVCESCNNKQTTPLILLHGHSFSGRSSAYTSTEMFSKLEDKFEKDKKYVITGILNPQSSEEYLKGDLGKQNVPAVFKQTYYVDYYNDLPEFIIKESKSNNIDSYALRLNEIVEYVKDVTGSEKVDILAHSMGGLVARKYIQAFGDGSINKFIMVGTPNKGIEDTTTTYCKIFGAKAECDDMTSESLFISKLNSPSNRIKISPYIIIGKGCEMSQGKDGDGVVLVSSAELSGANITYIQGKCDGFNYLHNELLNPNKYPEVYEKIVEILEE